MNIRILLAAAVLATAAGPVLADDADHARRVKVAFALAATHDPDPGAAERKVKVAFALSAAPDTGTAARKARVSAVLFAEPAKPAPCPCEDCECEPPCRCPEPPEECGTAAGLWPTVTMPFTEADLPQAYRDQLRAAGVGSFSGTARVQMTGFRTGKVLSLTATLSPGLEISRGGTEAAPPARAAVVPAGHHAHYKADGTVLIHGDENFGNAAAHQGVAGVNWPKAAVAGQPVPTPVAQAAAVQYAAPAYSAGGCPNGQCPTGAATYQPARRGIFRR